jgi:hypothetical protein
VVHVCLGKKEGAEGGKQHNSSLAFNHTACAWNQHSRSHAQRKCAMPLALTQLLMTRVSYCLHCSSHRPNLLTCTTLVLQFVRHPNPRPSCISP